MAAQAAVLGLQSRRGAVLALGGALFLGSDALLATNRFATALPLSGLWILATYWLAQWCIASWLEPPADAGPMRWGLRSAHRRPPAGSAPRLRR
jgi:hypothetical protein